VQYPMSKDEYRQAIEKLGLTQARAAWLLNGKSDRSGRRWANEGAPYHIALILTMMEEFGLTSEHIEAIGRRWREPIMSLWEG
jgi:hypothetical protein